MWMYVKYHDVIEEGEKASGWPMFGLCRYECGRSCNDEDDVWWLKTDYFVKICTN